MELSDWERSVVAARSLRDRAAEIMAVPEYDHRRVVAALALRTGAAAIEAFAVPPNAEQLDALMIAINLGVSAILTSD